jgi:DNA-binding CsgD family transcriptional regulator
VSDIAGTLHLRARRVANHHTLIKQKLQSKSDVELVVLALRHKLP